MKILEDTPFEGQRLENLDARFGGESFEDGFYGEDVLRADLERTEALRVYSSAHMEFNLLSASEVEAVLLGGATEDATLCDIDGVKRLRRALQFVDAIIWKNVGKASPLTEVDIQNLHALIVEGEGGGGVYRSVRIRDSNALSAFPGPAKIPEKIKKLVAWLPATREFPVMGSLIAHAWLMQIRPFQEGNGRMARAVSELILRGAGLPPVIILDSEKKEYFRALEQAWSELTPLSKFWAQHVEVSLKRCEEIRADPWELIDEEPEESEP